MLQAQNSVSGKVTDKDMNPIVGVSVYAPELHGTTTDVDGIIRSQIFLLVL
jgi:iron complex outermembrane receptor protein